MKCLLLLLSVLLLAFLAGALLGECEEPVWEWFIVAMVAVLVICVPACISPRDVPPPAAGLACMLC